MSVPPNTRNSASAAAVPADAQFIVNHALETFGSEQKAWHWLKRPNPLLDGSSPLEILQRDPARYELVEEELTRIDHGVFV